MAKEKMSRQALVTLAACCVCFGISIGLIGNCLGIFFTPISKALNVGLGGVSLIVTCNSMAAAFGNLLLVPMMRRMPLRSIMFGGVLLSAAALALMSFCKALWQFYICAVFLGLGQCTFGALPVTMFLQNQFGNKTGSVTGITMAFSGAAGAVLNPLISSVITAAGYQMAFRLMALLAALFVIPSVMVLRMRGGEKSESGSAKKEQIAAAAGSPLVYALIVILAVTTHFQASLNSHVSSVGVEAGYALSFGAMMVSAAMVSNVIFKLVMGTVSDKASPVFGTLMNLAIGCAGILILLFFRSVQPLALAGTFLYGAYFSCNTVALSLLTQKAAGPDYAKVYSKVTFASSISYALSVTAMGLLHDSWGSYQLPLMCIVGCTAVSALLVITIGSKLKKT